MNVTAAAAVRRELQLVHIFKRGSHLAVGRRWITPWVDVVMS
jgi:hypothetical protein